MANDSGDRPRIAQPIRPPDRVDGQDPQAELRDRPRQPYPPQQELGDDPMMRRIMPVGISGWAIASGYLGLVSVLLIPAPFAIITGILAIRAIRRNPRLHGMGRATFGIVMGTLPILLILALVVFSAIKG